MYLAVPALSQAWRSCGTAPARTIHPIPSHPVPSNPIPSGHHPIPYHTIPSHLIQCVRVLQLVMAEAHMYLGVPAFSQPWRSCGTAPAHTSHPIPSHPVRSNPIPSGHHTIPYHTIPYHSSSVVGCRSLSWQGHTCTWLCQPSPRRGAPAARLRRAQYIPSHLIPSRPIPSRQVTIPYHTILSHRISSSV